MSAQNLPQSAPRVLVHADRLPTEHEGRALVADGLLEQDVLLGVDADVVLCAHRLLADAVGWALEREQKG